MTREEFFDYPVRNRVINFMNKSWQWVPQRQIYLENAFPLSIFKEFLIGINPIINTHKEFQVVYLHHVHEPCNIVRTGMYDYDVHTLFNNNDLSYLQFQGYKDKYQISSNYKKYDLQKNRALSTEFSIRDYTCAFYFEIKTDRLKEALFNELTLIPKDEKITNEILF